MCKSNELFCVGNKKMKNNYIYLKININNIKNIYNGRINATSSKSTLRDLYVKIR